MNKNIEEENQMLNAENYSISLIMLVFEGYSA